MTSGSVKLEIVLLILVPLLCFIVNLAHWLLNSHIKGCQLLYFEVDGKVRNSTKIWAGTIFAVWIISLISHNNAALQYVLVVFFMFSSLDGLCHRAKSTKVDPKTKSPHGEN